MAATRARGIEIREGVEVINTGTDFASLYPKGFLDRADSAPLASARLSRL
jgi:hypothetical protein